MGAKFRFLGTERGIVFIEDLDRGISVTNDAEDVWNRVHGDGLDGPSKRLVYKDTQGEWWEMVPTYVDTHGTGQHSELRIKFKRWHGHVWDALNRVE
jgi:hypothetical protein